MATPLRYAPFTNFKRAFFTDRQSGLTQRFYRLTIKVHSYKTVGHSDFLPNILGHEHRLFFEVKHAKHPEYTESYLYELESLGTLQPSWTASFLVGGDFEDSVHDYVIRFFSLEMAGPQETCRCRATLPDMCMAQTNEKSYEMTGECLVDLDMIAHTLTAETEASYEIPDPLYSIGESSGPKSRQGSDAEVSSEDETNSTTPIDSGPVLDLEGVKDPLFEP